MVNQTWKFTEVKLLKLTLHQRPAWLLIPLLQNFWTWQQFEWVAYTSRTKTTRILKTQESLIIYFYINADSLLNKINEFKAIL